MTAPTPRQIAQTLAEEIDRAVTEGRRYQTYGGIYAALPFAERLVNAEADFADEKLRRSETVAMCEQLQGENVAIRTALKQAIKALERLIDDWESEVHNEYAQCDYARATLASLTTLLGKKE